MLWSYLQVVREARAHPDVHRPEGLSGGGACGRHAGAQRLLQLLNQQLQVHATQSKLLHRRRRPRQRLRQHLRAFFTREGSPIKTKSDPSGAFLYAWFCFSLSKSDRSRKGRVRPTGSPPSFPKRGTGNVGSDST
eukprot:4857145-Pyramimonas_sp.AAC.1